MLIDWFTVVAQAVNFLILVWLLKRFLFGPISKAIQERQELISSTLSAAAASKQEAEQEKGEFLARKTELENRCEALIKDAMAAGQTEKKRLLEEAQRAADALSQGRLDSLRSQEQKLEKALGERAQDEALLLARDILGQLAGTELDSAIVATFLQRLEQLDQGTREALTHALEGGAEAVLIRSAREFDPEQRRQLESGVEKSLGRRLQWTYKVEPELVNGFEFVAEGHKIGWSGAALLEQVRKGARLVQHS